MDGSEATVVHRPEAHRFEVAGGAGTAILVYRPTPGGVVFVHTEVPPAWEGRGVGGALARAGLDWAREEGLRVYPSCPFVRTWLDRHPEYSDLVESASPPG